MDDAGVVHDTREDGIGRLRGEQNLTTVGLDGAVVGDRRVQPIRVAADRAGNLKSKHAVAVEIDIGAGGTGEGHLAVVGEDHAGVHHGARDQGHGTGGGCGDESAVDNHALGVACDLLETPVPGHEVLGADIERGRHQGVHIDGGGLAEDDAVRVDQEHIAVRDDGAKNLAGVLVVDSVQCGRIGIRLGELDGVVLPDIECLPINDGILRPLLNQGGMLVGRVDGGLTTGDNTTGRAGRICEGHRRERAHSNGN